MPVVLPRLPTYPRYTSLPITLGLSKPCLPADGAACVRTGLRSLGRPKEYPIETPRRPREEQAFTGTSSRSAAHCWAPEWSSGLVRCFDRSRQVSSKCWPAARVHEAPSLLCRILSRILGPRQTPVSLLVVLLPGDALTPKREASPACHLKPSGVRTGLLNGCQG